MITTQSSRTLFLLFALTLSSEIQALSLSQAITQWISDHKDVFFYAACIGYVCYSQRQISQLKKTISNLRKQDLKKHKDELLGAKLAGLSYIAEAQKVLDAKIAAHTVEIEKLKLNIDQIKELGTGITNVMIHNFKEVDRIQKAQSQYVKIMLNDTKKSTRWKPRHSYNPRINKQSQTLKDLMFQVGRQETTINTILQRLAILEQKIDSTI